MEIQKKKGLNLIGRILMVSVIPIVILVFFAGLAIRAVGRDVSLMMAKHELTATTYAMDQTLGILSTGIIPVMEPICTKEKPI